jgi:uncharacterized membrane protein YbhN (UPF0104 family)
LEKKKMMKKNVLTKILTNREREREKWVKKTETNLFSYFFSTSFSLLLSCLYPYICVLSSSVIVEICSPAHSMGIGDDR